MRGLIVTPVAEIARYADDDVLMRDDRPTFRPGDRIRISWRSAAGHRRMPFYLRGKRGTVEAIVEPHDGGDESDGRRAMTHTYRLAIPLTEIWPDYVGSPRDGLRIEVVEPWLLRD
jgi:nitrile hydratase subunit beta